VSRGLVAILVLCTAIPAKAQVGASVTLQSDYRYRGRSISDQRPALSLSLSYDHKSGAYLGGTLTAGETRYDGVRALRYVAYAGYALRPTAGPGFDFGVSRYHVADYRVRKRTAEYNEIYGGLLTDHFSFRLNYAPNYYQSGLKTVYADISGTVRPSDSIRLFAHAGMLAPVGGRNDPGARRRRYDLSAGVSKQFTKCEISATWTTIDPQVIFSDGSKDKQNALVLTLSYFF
jgi:uncharacterized protein (TIGR02001 family)